MGWVSSTAKKNAGDRPKNLIPLEAKIFKASQKKHRSALRNLDVFIKIELVMFQR